MLCEPIEAKADDFWIYCQKPVGIHFRLSPLQKHVRKVVCGFGKKSCVSVSTSVRKPGNTCASPTAMI